MRLPQPTALAVAITLALMPALAAPARAGDPASPVAAIQKECGACHIPYQAWLMPVPAWAVVLDHLDNHFGEIASLPPATLAVIRDYYARNGAIGTWTATATEPVPRITTQPWWKRAMGGLDFKKGRIRSRANCGACHSNAAHYLGVHD